VTALALLIFLALQAAQLPAPATADPATSQFLADNGLLIVTIKSTATADYEAAIRLLQEALVKTTDPQRQGVARGWKVFKAQETDAKGNAIYIHLLLPVVPTFDYRVSLLIEEMVTTLPPDMLSKYRDAFAVGPTKLNLVPFADMSELPPPSNTSPTTVAPPKKPGP
jgi:hypothetical protein